MAKIVSLVRVLLFCVLFVGFVSSPTLSAQSSQTAKSTFHGAWEIQTNKGIYVISFIDDIFTIYTRDGGYVLDGIYHIGIKSPWGMSNKRNPQHTRNLFLMFDAGMGRDELGFTYEISSDRLILSSNGFEDTSSMPLSISGTPAFTLLSGTYGKSSFVESGGNPPVGFWKAEYTDGTVIFHFFPSKRGTLYVLIPDEQNFSVSPFSYTYESGTGTYTFINTGQTIPFTVSGNVLIAESAEHRKM